MAIITYCTQYTIYSALQLDVLDGIYKIMAEINIKWNANVKEKATTQ